jgi:hypothetical protein
MATHIRHYGSVARAFRATKRNIRKHSIGSVNAMFDAAWRSTQWGDGGPGIPVDTGATRASAKAGIGRPSFRRVPPRHKGAHYPARSLGEGLRSIRGYKVGNRIYISTGHVGGLLAYNRPLRSGPRARQPPTKQVPVGVGYMGLAKKAADKAFMAYDNKFTPEASR